MWPAAQSAQFRLITLMFQAKTHGFVASVLLSGAFAEDNDER